MSGGSVIWMLRQMLRQWIEIHSHISYSPENSNIYLVGVLNNKSNK